jgi:hypothetical protein
MKTNVKITLIEPHEMVCNLLIPKTLIVAPRQSGKTKAIREAIKQLDYYKIFVANKTIMDVCYTGIKNVHLGKDYNTTDIDSISWKIFVDDIEDIGQDPRTNVKYIPLDTPGIYAATTSKLDFDKIQQLIIVRRFDFERICIVGTL